MSAKLIGACCCLGKVAHSFLTTRGLPSVSSLMTSLRSGGDPSFVLVLLALLMWAFASLLLWLLPLALSPHPLTSLCR